MRTKFKDHTVHMIKCMCGKELTINVYCGHQQKEMPVKKRFTPPSAEEVEIYGRKIGLKIDGQTFCNYYNSVNWVVGRSCKPMKDWKAAVRYWKQSSKKNKTNYLTKEVKKNLEHLLTAYASISHKKLDSINTNDIGMVTRNVMSVYEKLSDPIKRKMELQGGARSFLKLYAKHISKNLEGYHSLQELSLDVDTKIWHGFLTWLTTQYFGIRNIFNAQ